MDKASLYFWVKTFHLVFVIAWMATVFYLPRILVNLAETTGQADVQARLLLMGRKLYRFGHNMFGLAVILGLVLWLGYKVIPGFPTMPINTITGASLNSRRVKEDGSARPFSTPLSQRPAMMKWASTSTTRVSLACSQPAPGAAIVGKPGITL